MLDPLKLADEIERWSICVYNDHGGPRWLSEDEYALIVRTLRALAPASGDVRERVARALCVADNNDPDRITKEGLAWNYHGFLADAALAALLPGDRIAGCEMVPAGQAEHGRRILEGIDQWVKAALEAPDAD